MKHFYATLIFCFVISNVGWAQCYGNMWKEAHGGGFYTFDTTGMSTSNVTSIFILTAGLDTLLVDSSTFHSSFHFDTNGTYRACFYWTDTINLWCKPGICCDITVDDAGYQPMLKDKNRWRMNTGPCPALASPGDPASRSDCGYFQVTDEVLANRDTLISGVAYKILELSYGSSGLSACDWGVIREDSVAKKVFARPMDEPSEIVLYDFSLKVGDTITRKFIGSMGYYIWGVYRVDSIKWLNLYPKNRGVYYLNNIQNSSGHTLVWVEGVGHAGNPLYLFSPYGNGNCLPGHCTSEPYKSIIPSDFVSILTCFYHNEVAYFDSCTYNDVQTNENHDWVYFEDSCRYYYVGSVNEVSSLRDLDISPNPTDGSITLQFDIKESSEFEIILHALDGRMVSGNYSLGRMSAGQQSRSLNLSNLSSGFYLLECRNKEGSVFKKLVISR